MINEEPTATTNEPKAPFFMLRAEESKPLALMCIAMADGMKTRGELKSEELLNGEFLEAFNRLKERLYSMKEVKDEDGNYLGQEIPLDVHESYAMMYSIVTPFYRLKAHVNRPTEKRDPHTEEMYYQLKDDAAALLQRLTKAWHYFDYGLQTLEEVFDIKFAARELKVDDKEIITTITLNQNNTQLFAFMFQWFDYLALIPDKYDFAYRFLNCQFIHVNDYMALKEKLLPKKKRKNLQLTLRDNISLYLMLNLYGRMFLSDAAKCFEEVGAEADAARPVSPPNKNIRNYFLRDPGGAAKTYEALGIKVDTDGTVHTSAKDMRDYFLKFGDQFIAEIRKQMKELPDDNKIFEEYIKRVDTWNTEETKPTNA
ncbi:MAG: hypothetical protein ACYDCN_15445 [Bacteroidia bacterium]